MNACKAKQSMTSVGLHIMQFSLYSTQSNLNYDLLQTFHLLLYYFANFWQKNRQGLVVH